MGKKQFCFFQTAETGNRTPDSGVKGSGANHYPRAPAQHKAQQSWLAMTQTHLLVMLPCQIHKLFLRPEPKQGENHPQKCWSIALLRITVGPEVYRNVSFMHHIIGWYTTSGVGIGNKAVLILHQYSISETVG